MKYCLNCRQFEKYLREVDEIRIEYRDRKALVDFAEKYPDKVLILEHNVFDDAIDWDAVKKYQTLARNNFVFCLDNIKDCMAAKDNNIKFFINYPITSWTEFNAIYELGVEYVYLGAPLFFHMDKFEKFNIKIRLVPNIAFNDGIQHESGYNGTWVRPEDIDKYEPYAYIVDFKFEKLEREQALYRIYAQDKQWPGDLLYLVADLGDHAINRLINPISTQSRLTCGQRCAEPDGACRICQRLFQMANIETLTAFQDKTN